MAGFASIGELAHTHTYTLLLRIGTERLLCYALRVRPAFRITHPMGWRGVARACATSSPGCSRAAPLRMPELSERASSLAEWKTKKKIYEEENKPPIHALTFRAFYFYIHIQIMRDDARSYYYVIYFLNYTYLVTLNKMMMMMMIPETMRNRK